MTVGLTHGAICSALVDLSALGQMYVSRKKSSLQLVGRNSPYIWGTTSSVEERGHFTKYLSASQRSLKGVRL